MNADPIVITGMGLVLPCGDGLEAARASWQEERPCFTPLPAFLGPGLGGVCTAFNPAGIIPPMTLRRLDRPSRYAWVAAHQAFADAALDPKAEGERMAIAAGSVTGGSEAGETFMRPYFERGVEGASPMVFPNCVANAASGHLSIAFGIKGPAATLVDRESAALLALDQGMRWLRAGLVHSVLLVGTDGLFPLLVELLHGVRRISSEQPRAGSGKGLVPGEGAQAFVLETLSGAQARGARIRARIQGWASSAPAKESPAARRQALARAVEELGLIAPERWIGGASGLATLDDTELPLAAAHPEWPVARHPKLLWGEFGGSGGQLLAAALLEPSRQTLVTSPSSGGPQVALVLEDVSG